MQGRHSRCRMRRDYCTAPHLVKTVFVGYPIRVGVVYREALRIGGIKINVLLRDWGHFVFKAVWK